MSTLFRRVQLGDVVVLQLEEIAVGAEHLVIPVQFAPCPLRAFVADGAGDLGSHAAGGADQAFRMGSEKILIDARVIIKTFQLAGAEAICSRFW